MRRKGNPSTLLMGMQTGEATVENSMEFPQKFFFWFGWLLFLFSLIFVQVQFSAFSSHPGPSLQPSPSPSPVSIPPCYCPCVLYSSSWKPLSQLYSPHSHLAIVRLFLTSMSLVIFCLLFSSMDYVQVKGEIIWYLSLTVWLISLGIMISSSIHAAKRV